MSVITLLQRYPSLILHVISPLLGPPFINSPAVGRRIGEGNPFRIDCLAVGQPTPTVTWFRDGVRIVNSSRVQVDSRSVLVTASTVTDSGVYLCVANNSAGMTSHSLDMDIRIREGWLQEQHVINHTNNQNDNNDQLIYTI